MSLEQRELQAQFYWELGQVHDELGQAARDAGEWETATGYLEAACDYRGRAIAIMRADNAQLRRKLRQLQLKALRRGYVYKPRVAEISANLTPDLTPAPRRAARPRERRDGSRSSARSGDSGDSDEPPAAPEGVAP